MSCSLVVSLRIDRIWFLLLIVLLVLFLCSLPSCVAKDLTSSQWLQTPTLVPSRSPPPFSISLQFSTPPPTKFPQPTLNQLPSHTKSSIPVSPQTTETVDRQDPIPPSPWKRTLLKKLQAAWEKDPTIIITCVKYPGIFADVADGVISALNDLGVEAFSRPWEEVKKVARNDTRIHLIFAYNALHRGDVPLPKFSILYQAEQLYNESIVWEVDFYRGLLNTHYIWDYCRDNVQFLLDKRVDWVSYLPPSYFPELPKMAGRPSIRKPLKFDVVVFGGVTPRRSKMIQLLDKQGVHIGIYIGSVYGSKKDLALREGTIILNLHKDPKVFQLETVRLHHLLANKCFVISENGTSDDGEWEDSLVMVPYPRLVETILIFLGKMPSEYYGITSSCDSSSNLMYCDQAAELREAAAKKRKEWAEKGYSFISKEERTMKFRLKRLLDEMQFPLPKIKRSPEKEKEFVDLSEEEEQDLVILKEEL